MTHDLRHRIDACGVLVATGPGGFAHLATAFSCAPGEWLSCWDARDGERPLPDTTRLLTTDGTVHALEAIEHDGGLLGFRSATVAHPLNLAPEGAPLGKFDPLWAVGFPCVIEHPAFALHRGSLDAALYLPYLCPWTIPGHCALFGVDDGWLTGRCYPGMEGSPVLDEQGRAIGLLVGSQASPEHPPLARFHRLAG